MNIASNSTNPAPGFRDHPAHEITLTPFRGTVEVFADHVRIASSDQAMLVHETNHEPVYYLPIEHVDSEHVQRSQHVTRCPFKGKASYWNVAVGPHEIDNAMWGYETPYDEMLELAGMVAFYSSKVRVAVS